MSSTTAPTTTCPGPPKPLPQVPCPKLAPFTPTAYAEIVFDEQLGDPENNLEGYVWKVKINGKAPYFALKMVSIKDCQLRRRLLYTFIY
jgi:hypothetical protein